MSLLLFVVDCLPFAHLTADNCLTVRQQQHTPPTIYQTCQRCRKGSAVDQAIQFKSFKDLLWRFCCRL